MRTLTHLIFAVNVRNNYDTYYNFHNAVSTLKADILNITYDCYSPNNNVKIATLQI